MEKKKCTMKSDRLMRNNWYNSACVFLRTFTQQQSINVRSNVLVSLNFLVSTKSVERCAIYSVIDFIPLKIDLDLDFLRFFSFTTYQKHKLPFGKE